MTTKFKPTTEMKSAASILLTAIALTATIRPVIEGIQRELLALGKYKYARLERSEAANHEFITEPKRAWLMSDKDHGHYTTELHARYISAGFKVEFGFCPLLIAEHAESDARRVLINVMEPVTGLSFDMIFQAKNALENYNKFIDLTLRLLTPYCVKKSSK